MLSVRLQDNYKVQFTTFQVHVGCGGLSADAFKNLGCESKLDACFSVHVCNHHSRLRSESHT